MGAIQELVRTNTWTIVSADKEIELELEGQFEPEGGAEVDGRPTLASTTTAGSSAPAVQWVAGGGLPVRIKSSFYSAHQADDIRPKKALLERLGAKDETLGRAPRVTFAWGDVRATGFALVRYTVGGLWPISGWPMAVLFEIEIKDAPALDFDGSSSTTGTGETQILTLADGEIFETLGLRFYGDPLLGELIRRENPKCAAGEKAGDRVKVLEREHPRARVTVAPSSPSFLDRRRTGRTWQPLVAELAATRAVEGGTPWELLPEVLSGELEDP